MFRVGSKYLGHVSLPSPHTQPLKESRGLKCCLSFFCVSCHWFGVQLLEMTGIFFFNYIYENEIFQPSVFHLFFHQNPDCPSFLFPRSADFTYTCIFHVVSQHHNCAGAIPQTYKHMNSHEKTNHFVNSLYLDLSSLSDLPQLTPFLFPIFLAYLFILLLFSLLMRY